MRHWKQKLLQQISIKVLIVAVLFLASLYGFGLIAHEAVLENEDEFDETVHNFLHAHSSDGFIRVMRYVTFLGSSSFLLPAYIVMVAILLLVKRFRLAIDVAVIGLSSWCVMYIMKTIFHRHRPDLPIIKGITTYSFPSGHTLSSFIFCSLLAYITWRATNLPRLLKWLITIVLFLLAFMVGFSRIALNVHFATDVIAGFCLGVMWVIVSFAILRKINRASPADKGNNASSAAEEA